MKGSINFWRHVSQQVLYSQELGSKGGKTNHSTQNHWPGGKHPNVGKGKSPQTVSSFSGNKKKNNKKGKGKGKEKAPESANVLQIVDIPELLIISSESIIAVFKIVGTAMPQQLFEQVHSLIFNQLFLPQTMSNSLESLIKI